MKRLMGFLRWLVTLAFLAMVFYQVPLSEWLPIFADVDWRWFAVSFMLMGLVVIVNTYKWHMLLNAQGLKVSYFRAFYHYGTGYFFNSFITGTGDIKRAADLGNEVQALPQVAASVISERWTGVIGQVGLALITILFAFEKSISIWPLALFALGIIVFLAVVYRWLETVEPDKVTCQTGVLGWVNRIRLSLSVYKDSRACLYKAVLYSFAAPFLLVVVHFTLAHSLGFNPSPSFETMLLFVPTISVFAQLPVTINGFGLQDFFMVTMFKNCFLPSQALALSMIFHALRLCVGGLGGVLYALVPNLGKGEMTGAISRKWTGECEQI